MEIKLNDEQKSYFASHYEDNIYEALSNFEWVLTDDKKLDIDGNVDDGFPYVVTIDKRFYDAITKEFADEILKMCKIVCPVCGKEMDESYLGQHFCKQCEQNLAKAAVNKMNEDGWCEGCSGDFEKCLEKGKCEGSK